MSLKQTNRQIDRPDYLRWIVQKVKNSPIRTLSLSVTNGYLHGRTFIVRGSFTCTYWRSLLMAFQPLHLFSMQYLMAFSISAFLAEILLASSFSWWSEVCRVLPNLGLWGFTRMVNFGLIVFAETKKLKYIANIKQDKVGEFFSKCNCF